jgi:hypothetical protein
MSTPIETMAEKAAKTRDAAEKAARELAEAEAARDERVSVAVRDLATWRLDVHSNDLYAARAKASDAYDAAKADAIATADGFSLDSLLAAFANYREANAVWVSESGAAAANADRVFGMHRNSIGVEIPRTAARQDSTANLSFAAELDSIVASRVARVVAAQRADIDTREAQAMADAEAGK